MRLRHARTAMLGVLAGAALLQLASPVTGAPQRPPLTLSTEPELQPAFAVRTYDYAVRCRDSVRLRLRAPSTTDLRIDGRPVEQRDQDILVPLRVGERVRVSATAGRRTRTYNVRCIPSDFPRTLVHGHARGDVFYLATPASGTGSSFVAIFNGGGIPLWWMRARGQAINATPLPGERLGWSHRHPLAGGTPTSFVERQLDGREIGSIVGSGILTDYHELRPLRNGHVLVLGYRPRRGVDLSAFGRPRNATVLDGVIEELDATGRVVWTWSTRGHLAIRETERWACCWPEETLPGGEHAYDVFHLNSIEPAGRNLIVSSRHADAIYAISRSTRRIVWKLGGRATPKSLSVGGTRDARGLFGGQHDARVLGDGSITVHDNQTLWARGPRALRLRIDAHNRTAHVIERIPGPGHSPKWGSARKIANRDWVISWGGIGDIAQISRAARVVFRLQLRDGYLSYRVVPVSAKELPAPRLRAGMDRMALDAAGPAEP